MKKLYTALPFIILLSVITGSNTYAQNVGINNTGATPHAAAMLHIDLGSNLEKGFLIPGTSSTLALMPNLGRGSRLMFYPAKSAFRAGWVNGTEWDNINVGCHSVAMGVSTIARGDYATAIGIETIASGESATAMEEETKAIGGISTAMGFNTFAGAAYSNAFGFLSSAGGQDATAMGYQTNASGQSSTAIGYNTWASGLHSMALGTNVSTNNKKGSFFFGDTDPNNKGQRPIGFTDQFAARFNGGYYFISSDAGADIGVQVLA